MRRIDRIAVASQDAGIRAPEAQLRSSPSAALAAPAWAGEAASRAAHAHVVWAHAAADAARGEAARLARLLALVPGALDAARPVQAFFACGLDAWLALANAYGRAYVRKTAAARRAG